MMLVCKSLIGPEPEDSTSNKSRGYQYYLSIQNPYRSILQLL